ncbi:RagB/SusD family nutrient uptake outer membrane protein [Bacteroides sp. 214]|uniref:RagB/SusD family nutrient uptake outer membrane protein n=1 Tax=Bacteroides sp. 214 TaxID=2302935 RepID=UPI0013D6F545|nr:RagB/SusD family nutrient uptake outer membrane protein [Bacteroides sp. 214]NDW12205.1 RagB/SusD family nutrient uptake outer membrane protein [Bacteroides sp. 214]
MKNNIKLFSLALVASVALASCSDSFLEEKKDHGSTNTDIYNYYSGADGRIRSLYARALPNTNADAAWNNPSTGRPDVQSKSTEEYTGFDLFVDPTKELTALSGDRRVPSYFHYQMKNAVNVYGRIRDINDAIIGIEEGSLSREEKDQLVGQAYFLRAWCYYNIVKYYGGIPIVTEKLEPVESSKVPRFTTKACIEFMCDDLDKAAEMLKATGAWDANNFGRVTAGAALALKGRIQLLWASPIFNRANEVARWETAYTTIKNSIPVLEECGHGLFRRGNNVNGSDFAAMFSTIYPNPEAVFVSLCNQATGDDEKKNNPWERNIRPANSLGQGSYEASDMMLNQFPMADGKRPSVSGTYTNLEVSELEYDINFPFANRDPRFYRTFAFPGVRWAYSGNPTQSDAKNPSYNEGKDYVLWNYVWYTSTDDQGNPEGTSYAADNLLNSKRTVYIRKRSDDYDVMNSVLYKYEPGAGNNAFALSAAPYMEIRYAEVLLNYAEAACGAGHLSEAVEQLRKIRERAGYTSETNYGLQADLTSNEAACMSAIIYERQIELAYEGKRFDDLRRWMLYDGGIGKVEGAPNTWTLSGWGGNTCIYLGFKPLNGQRRDKIEFRLADSYGVGGTTADSDPLLKAGVERPAAIDFRKEDLDTQLETLRDFYKTNFVAKKKIGDARTSDKVDLYIDFRPKYYLLGFNDSAMGSYKEGLQTIGWEDTNKGNAPGTFDPLAE